MLDEMHVGGFRTIFVSEITRVTKVAAGGMGRLVRYVLESTVDG